MYRTAMLIALVGVGLAGGAAAQQFKIAKADIEFKEGFDFTKYETYSWKESQEPLPDEANDMAMILAVEDGLRKAKLEKVEEDPDLEVRFYTKVERTSKATGYQEPAVEQSNLRTMVRVDKSTRGNLTIELYDPEARTVVWKGTDSEPLGHKSNDQSAIREVVNRILREYPPKKK